jgi:hypothetical protein
MILKGEKSEFTLYISTEREPVKNILPRENYSGLEI